MFGGHGGVQVTTNLATIVYVSKSAKLQKHTLTKQTQLLRQECDLTLTKTMKSL